MGMDGILWVNRGKDLETIQRWLQQMDTPSALHQNFIHFYFLGIQWASLSSRTPEHVHRYDHLFWLLDSFSSRGGVGRYSTLPLSGASPLSLVSHMYLVVSSGSRIPDFFLLTVPKQPRHAPACKRRSCSLVPGSIESVEIVYGRKLLHI